MLLPICKLSIFIGKSETKFIPAAKEFDQLISPAIFKLVPPIVWEAVPKSTVTGEELVITIIGNGSTTTSSQPIEEVLLILALV